MAPRYIVLLLLLGLYMEGSVLATPLDDYVNTPDSHYEYTIIGEKRVPGQYVVYTVNMTSQKWLTYDDSDTSIWFHYLMITVPDKLTNPEHCFLWITGGSTSHYAPDPVTDSAVLQTSEIAVGAGVFGATLRQVPNQPVVFKTDPLQKSRTEDAVIAFTWRHFIEDSSNPYWLLRMPMTKAVVRAMDTVTDAMYTHHPGPANVTKFIVGGESKRGWTTWTTAAVDKRVVGMTPTVLDVLNFIPNMHHHYRSLGGWTFVFNDYYDENITVYLDDPRTKDMADIVDPFAYRDRLTMPKLICTAGSDEFFLPDDSYYYFNDLPEPKYLHIFPNDEHGIRFHELEQTHLYTSFVLSIAEPDAWVAPKFSWKRYENSTHGIIEFTTDMEPLSIISFRTLTNRGPRRDFRLATAPIKAGTEAHLNLILYKKFPVSNPEPGKYVAEFLTPHIGWQCFFIRADYPAPGGTTISFTTEANITPTEKFAVPDCHGEECKGTLV